MTISVRFLVYLSLLSHTQLIRHFSSRHAFLPKFPTGIILYCWKCNNIEYFSGLLVIRVVTFWKTNNNWLVVAEASVHAALGFASPINHLQLIFITKNGHRLNGRVDPSENLIFSEIWIFWCTEWVLQGLGPTLHHPGCKNLTQNCKNPLHQIRIAKIDIFC